MSTLTIMTYFSLKQETASIVDELYIKAFVFISIIVSLSDGSGLPISTGYTGGSAFFFFFFASGSSSSGSSTMSSSGTSSP